MKEKKPDLVLGLREQKKIKGMETVEESFGLSAYKTQQYDIAYSHQYSVIVSVVLAQYKPLPSYYQLDQ